MGSKPKSSDYKPSEADKANAAVAWAEHKYFKQKYDPLLQKMRDDSTSDDSRQNLRARANADTMQTLAGRANYDAAASGRGGGDMAQAYQGQLGIANQSAEQIQNQMQTGVLGTARGQAADAQSGMANASRMEESQALTRAAAKQQKRQAATAALGQIGTSLIMQGAKNMGTEGQKARIGADGQPIRDEDGKIVTDTVKGSFLSPVDDQGNKVSGFKARLGHTNYFNTNPFGG